MLGGNGYLIQCGSYDCQALLGLAAPRHCKIAEAQGLEYRADYTPRSPQGYIGAWDKIAFLILTLDLIREGSFVASLAADTWIQNERVDFRSALPSGYDLACLKGHGFLNSDVLFCRNSPALRAFLSLCWNKVPGYRTENQDALIYDQLTAPECALKVHALSDHWNYFDTWQGLPRPVCCKKPEAYILHWASIPRAEVQRDFERMTA